MEEEFDIIQKSSRSGDVSLKTETGREDISITWKPQHKKLVSDYANSKGLSFSHLVEKIIDEHVAKECRKRRWKKGSSSKAILTRLKGPLPLSSYVRATVLEHIDKNPLRELPPVPKEVDLRRLKETRPDALVYTIPIVGARIVAAPDGEGGWRGVVFDPAIAGSTSAWHSQHLNPPVWAKTPTVLRAMTFVASRIDMDGKAWFSIPRTSFRISAVWNGERYERGTVVDAQSKHQQNWLQAGWYAHMENGRFNLLPNVRRALNLLCRTITIGNGGLEVDVPRL